MARLVATLVVCLIPSLAFAQQPRDAIATQRAGNASVTGIILSDETPARPLRRARVMLNGTELDIGRTAITNDDGSFAFAGLPPGHYTLSATKDGYVTMSYGARRPNRPGPGFSLRAGESLRLSMPLPRGAVITGTIIDPEGLPAQGVRVLALAYQFVRGPDERRLTPLGTAAPQTTDDRGTFRIFGLPPGDYIVGALPHSAMQIGGEVHMLSESELRRALNEVRASGGNARPGPSRPSPPPRTAPVERRRSVGMVPVYFPGTTMLQRAAVVTLALGQERTGVDIQLQYVPTAIVEGTVSYPMGAQQPTASIVLTANERSGPAEATRSSRSGPDGRFSIRGVPPGDYTLIARMSVPAPRTPSGTTPFSILVASTELQVEGDNAPEVFLSPQPGLTISGTVLLDGGPPPSVSLPPIRLNAPLLQAGTNAVFAMPPVELDAEGRFTVSGIPPGSYRMIPNLQGIRAPIGLWWLKSFIVNGRDLLDTGLDLRQSTSNAVIAFSTRTSVLSGAVKDPEGNAAPEHLAIVFSTDKSHWFPHSRRIAAVKPSPDGRYTIKNLPPGDYFVLAFADIEPGEWFDRLVLEQLVPEAVRVTLGQDEQKSHDITIAAR